MRSSNPQRQPQQSRLLQKWLHAASTFGIVQRRITCHSAAYIPPTRGAQPDTRDTQAEGNTETVHSQCTYHTVPRKTGQQPTNNKSRNTNTEHTIARTNYTNTNTANTTSSMESNNDKGLPTRHGRPGGLHRRSFQGQTDMSRVRVALVGELPLVHSPLFCGSPVAVWGHCCCCCCCVALYPPKC